MIDRESAWCLLTEFTQSESLRKHALAVEACMRACVGKKKFADGSGRVVARWGFNPWECPKKSCGASSD